jgi:hypothetical protein
MFGLPPPPESRRLACQPKLAECCKRERRLVRPEGLEPPALWFEARCSIQLSYGRDVPILARRYAVAIVMMMALVMNLDLTLHQHAAAPIW